jgi:hypothetical protein
MGLRGRLRRLEREAEEEMIVVPQKDGTARRFPREAGMDALLSLIDGRDHPLAQAARDSSDPKWASSWYCAFPINPDEVEDLSE